MQNVLTFCPLKPLHLGSTAREYESLIRSSLLDALLHAGAICADAGWCLTELEQTEFMRLLGWSDRTFDDFIKIGFDSRLRSNDVHPFLPPIAQVLGQITSLSEDQLAKAINDGTIHPQMNVQSLVDWVKVEATTMPRVRRRRAKKARTHEAVP